MANCPSCSQNIKIDDSSYGTLFTCPHCQSVFFVGWDGQPETALNSAEPSTNYFPENTTYTPPEGESIAPQAMDFISPVSSFVPEENSHQDFLAQEPVHDSNNSGTFPAKENFADVVEFANAVEDKGLITYDLTISGIDLSHLHQQIIDALTDSKFNWRVEDILAQIQNGTLVLQSLSPAKTVVLVQRLKFLPLEIRWRQNVLTT